MTTCDLCALKEDKALMLSEGKNLVAALFKEGSVPGHSIIATKNHYPILEQVPDIEAAECFVAANKISSALFEALQAHGTNIIIQNGISAGQSKPHFLMHIIPRREKDGLDFQWQTKKLDEEEMSTVELKLKEHTSKMGAFEKEKKEPIKMDRKIEKIEGDNYLIRQLRRLP